MTVKATTSGVVRQMQVLSNPETPEVQVQRVLRTRVKRLGDQKDEERTRVVRLVAQTVARRNMHLEAETFEELLRQMVLDAGQGVFEDYAIFFSGQVKNGYRLAGRALLKNLRLEIRAEYQERGGFERKLELRRSLPKLAFKLQERNAAVKEIEKLRQLEAADERTRALLKLW